jgi:pescadillo
LESEERLKTLPEKLQTIQPEDTSSLSSPVSSPVSSHIPEEDFADPTSSTPPITYISLSNSLSSLDTLQNLFSSLKFYLSREVPRYSLEFVIKSFGGEVGWDSSSVGAGSAFDENDESITHQVVDRPRVEENKNRAYVQPQWVYDCINAQKLLKSDLYKVGRKLPAHLSPFVENKEGEYVPTVVQEIGNEEEIEREASDVEDEDIEEEIEDDDETEDEEEKEVS